MPPVRQLRRRADTSGRPKYTGRKATSTPRPLKYFKDTSIVLPNTTSCGARVWTEVAYIVEEKSANKDPAVTDVGPDDDGIEIDFEQLIDRMNQREMSTGMRKKKTGALDARNILQDTGADCGHLELRYRGDTPRQVETITVLPDACKTLTTSVRRMRAFPDVTDVTVYKGTSALAKRHFLPAGSKPTTKAQLAEKNIERYEKLLALEKKHQMTALGIHAASQEISFESPSPSEDTIGPQDDTFINETQKGSDETMATGGNEDSNVEQEEQPDMSVSANVPVTPSRTLRPINWVRTAVTNIWYNTPESLIRRPARNPCVTPSPVSQLESTDGDDVDLVAMEEMPVSHEENDDVGKLFHQNVTFEERLATLSNLYATTLEQARQTGVENEELRRKLTQAEHELESARQNLVLAHAQIKQLSSERNADAARVAQVCEVNEKLRAQIRNLGLALQTMSNFAQNTIAGIEEVE